MEKTNSIFNKIYLWLGFGLLVTFLTGYYLSENIQLLGSIINGNNIFIFMIITLGITFLFKLLIKKLPVSVLRILYITFSILLGVTFGSVFYIYELSSIISTFLMTSFIFVGMAIYGHVTKNDLSGFGKILTFSLLGIIIFSLLNFFIFKSSLFVLGLSAISALIFTLFIAYDIQKIKSLLYSLPQDKTVIYGAFELYLDFINLFLDLIRLFGKRK